MNSIPNNLKSAMAARNINQASLAKSASTKRQQVSQQTIQQLLSGRNQSSRALPAIARALGVRIEWLTENSGPMDAAPTAGAPVPVVSFVQAGNWTASPISDDIDDWVGVDSRVSGEAFALRVKGLSMMPRFQHGDVIIIDPAIQPVPGDFVVAKIRGQEEATFKLYRQKSPKEYELKALNEDYPTLTVTSKTDVKILGPVVEHHSYRRQV